MEMVLFFILAIVAVLSGLGVIAQRNAVRSALFLLVNFCCLAGLYLLLYAQFVAVVQVIVYASAIVVLFLFAVMLLGAERAEETPDNLQYQWLVGGLLGVLLLVGVVLAVTGWGGLLVAAVATAIGLLPVMWGSRRMNCMGVLLLPLTLQMAGLGTIVAGWLGLI